MKMIKEQQAELVSTLLCDGFMLFFTYQWFGLSALIAGFLLIWRINLWIARATK